MYVSALRVLSDLDSPDRLALAAHGFRELMEKIPEYLAVPMPAHRESLKPRVQGLHGHWRATLSKTKSRVDGLWNGAIDAHLDSFLRKLPEFFKWFEDHNPLRRDEVRAVLKKLQGGEIEISPPLEDENIRNWIEIRDYFVSTAHHRARTAPDEFFENLSRLEVFLTERLAPRTFDDFAEIDEILGTDDNAK
jgi:hypothetical protein